MAKSYVGIDIGYDRLKLALVQDGIVKKTAFADIPDHMIQEGRVISVGAMAEIIKDSMKEHGFHCNNGALILSDETVFLRNVTMPIMSEEQLLYNLPYEFRDYITDELNNYLFDYAMYTEHEELVRKAKGQTGWKDEELLKKEDDSEDEKRMDLLAVAVPKNLMDDMRVMMRKSGLHLKVAAPVVTAYTNLLRRYKGGLNECGILDLGYHSVRMHVFKGDRHMVTRELETGLSVFDDLIAELYHVDLHLAHTYIETNYDDCLNSEACKNAYTNLAVELMRAVNFYRFSNPDSNLDDLFICGGGAYINPLIEEIRRTLDLNLHQASSLVVNGERIPDIESLVQAIGIAMN